MIGPFGEWFRMLKHIKKQIDSNRSQIAQLTQQVKEIRLVQGAGASILNPFLKYQNDPVAYAHDVLGFKVIWSEMEEVLRSVLQPPYRTLVKSGHKIGKSTCAGILVNWWFDCFDPSVVITTGATYEAMVDTVWGEVRLQRKRAGLKDYFIGPAAPEMWSSEEHWAKLLNVNNSTSFHGRHRQRQMFLFDEATAIDGVMFTVASTMFKPEPGNAWVCFFNPTDPTRHIYNEEMSGAWRVFSLPSTKHPNIVAQIEARSRGVELHSDQLPIPNAISISMVDLWVKQWCEQIRKEEATATDFAWQWPDGSITWHRPEADWEARCEGMWPKRESTSVWSDHLFKTVVESVAAVPIHLLPEIGCDVARLGPDQTAVHCRWGSLSLSHQSRQGIRETESAGWLIEIANDLAAMVNEMRRQDRSMRAFITPEEIPIKIDDAPVGGGVIDILLERGFRVISVNAGSNANDPTRYPNKRSELWFSTKWRAFSGGIAFSVPGPIGANGVVSRLCRLDKDTVQRLRLQATAPTWKLDSVGRRVVEEKAMTKKRLQGRSPDDMDAMNLAYYEVSYEAPRVMDVPIYDSPGRLGGHDARTDTFDEVEAAGQVPARERRKLFGR